MNLKKWFSGIVIFVVGFLGIPALTRLLFHWPIIKAVSNYWALDELAGQTYQYTHAVRNYAEFYARVSFNLVFLIFLAVLLIFFIFRSRTDLDSWGFHWNRILPGILYFVGFWVIGYILFVTVGSMLSGGSSYYLGMPDPPGVEPQPIINPTALDILLKDMFFPRAIFAFQGPDPGSVIGGNWLMGTVDFIRTWVMNGPILMALVFGYFFNTLLTGFGANTEEGQSWSNLKGFAALFFASLMIPLYQYLFRLVDAGLSQVQTQVQGAEIQQVVPTLQWGSVIWSVVFWFVAAIMFNLAYLWVTEQFKRKMTDWGESLSKWVPGFIIFVIGIIVTFAAGWPSMEGVFGPFTNYFGLFAYAFICGYIYIKTRNVIATALVFASLPWFLNFILITPRESPTLVGSIIGLVITLIALYAFTEIYRFWAPYLTFKIVEEEIPELESKIQTPEKTE